MSEQQEPRITIAETGPYLVSGGPILTHRAGIESAHGEPVEWDLVGAESQDYETNERYALCRCGASSNKPFCDGAHTTAGKDLTVTTTRDGGETRREVLVGDGVVMTDDTTLCADAGFCGSRFTNVWKMIEDTSDPEVRDRLKRMVHNCPSGRLQFSDTEGGAPIEPEYRPSIATLPDGPLWVRGNVAIGTSDGFTYEVRNRMTLCRCGNSQNKPFCDGAHKTTNFQA